MKYATVCSGIGAPECAFQDLGWSLQFSAEIEKFPSAVHAHHYPNCPNLGDITQFKDWPSYAIDLLVGGTPCQSFSVAGLRKGLADPRGNLALTFLAIVERYQPRYVVWENVPGILSDQGKAFHSFLDGLEKIGYAIIGLDILDAQWFGLAQRRRRIFVCAQRIEDLLNSKTIFSGLIATQCLAEIWRNALAVLCARLNPEDANFNCESSKSERLLKKRIGLFNLQKGEQVLRLLNCLDALHQSFGCGQSDSGSDLGKTLHPIPPSIEATKSPKSGLKTASIGEYQSIESSWKNMLADALRIANGCITSTASSETTESKIFICAQAQLIISRFMLGLNPSLPNYSHGAASCLTALRAFTNYARLTSTELFGDVGRVRRWFDFLGEAERTAIALSNVGIECFGKVLPLSESLCGHPPPRRQTGEGIAIGTSPSLTGSGRGTARTGESRGQDCVIPIQEIGKRQSGTPENGSGYGKSGDPMFTLQSSAQHGVCATLTKNYATHHGRTAGNNGGVAENQLIPEVAHSLNAEGFDASEDGTGRGTPLVATVIAHGQGHAEVVSDGSPSLTCNHEAPIAFQPRIGRNGHSAEMVESGIVNALNSEATGGSDAAPCVAFQTSQSGVRQVEAHATLDSNNGSRRHNGVVQGYAVRRLTPTECERLQGFPDGWTNITFRGKPAADGPRYKALGNSMAVPVLKWIGQRIKLIDSL